MVNSNITIRRGGDAIIHPPRARQRSNSSSSTILRRLYLLTLLILVVGFYTLSFQFLLKKDAHIATGISTSSSFVFTTASSNNNNSSINSIESSLMTNPAPAVAAEMPVIAHAISLIKCSKGSSVTGFLDAAAILQHSIHKQSIHSQSILSSQNNNSLSLSQHQHRYLSTSSPRTTPSRYSYQMYAIVHTSCAEHATVLAQLGYTILVKDHPVKKDDIKGEWLRNHIESENCCGSAEFIKLYGKCLSCRY